MQNEKMIEIHIAKRKLTTYNVTMYTHNSVLDRCSQDCNSLQSSSRIRHLKALSGPQGSEGGQP